MSAIIIKQGKVLGQGEADVLIAHGKAKKVTAVDIMTYSNGYSALYVTFGDGAIGCMNGMTKSELWTWASEQKKWPLRNSHGVSVPYPIVFDDSVAPPSPVVVKRTRGGAALPATVEEEEVARSTDVVITRVVSRTRAAPAPAVVKRVRRER